MRLEGLGYGYWWAGGLNMYGWLCSSMGLGPKPPCLHVEPGELTLESD